MKSQIKFKSKIVWLSQSLLCMMLLTSGATYSQQPFITKWKTDTPGTSNKSSITIPTTGTGYNYEVDWNNDGTYDQSGLTGNVTHDFGEPGTYIIRIRGSFPRIYFNGSVNYQKIIDIIQWGDVEWTSMESAFYGCYNLNISASDLPNLSEVTSMAFMFAGCEILNGPANIGKWNTSNVTNMLRMFYHAYAFNQPIGSWNTTNVINMRDMFHRAEAFNQPIGNWKTGSVTNMSSMFYGAATYNKAIGSWNTVNVTSMSFMFKDAVTFNQPVGNWNTANVTTMEAMFALATAFNQPVGSWNTAKVTIMSSMFAEATAFNQSLANWNTADVTNMSTMFNSAVSFNQPLDNWNTANVLDMRFMFESASAFNQPIGNWSLHPEVQMHFLFNNSAMNCENYSATLIGWNNNPATPSGRFLGAIGRQYGTNAVMAHKTLDVTKNWTFDGDAPSGIDCSRPLPVVLTSFTGKLQDEGVVLSWKTISESNNAGFEIEKSGNAKDFKKIGFVDGAGDANVLIVYRLTDTTPLPTTYYRLKQLDLDGKFEYSRIISVQRAVEKFVIYPNPTSDNFYLAGFDSEQKVVVKDAKGNVVKRQIWTSGNPIKVNHLPAGLYFITVAGETRKVIVCNETR